MAGQTPMVKLGGVWIRQSPKIGTFMSGPLTQATKFFIFRNPKKPKGSQSDEPDYFLYIGSNAEPKTQPEPATQKAQGNPPPPDPDGSWR